MRVMNQLRSLSKFYAQLERHWGGWNYNPRSSFSSSFSEWLTWLTTPDCHQQQGSRRRCLTSRVSSSLLVTVAIVSLTGVAGSRFYNKPRLAVGTVAPETIYALENAIVEDKKATEEKRKAVLSGAESVMAVDSEKNKTISRNLDRLIAQGDQLRSILGPFPFVTTSILSTPAQIYLRQSSDAEWQGVIQAVTKVLVADPWSVQAGSMAQASVNPPPALSAEQEQAIANLRSYRQNTSSLEFGRLMTTVGEARWKYTQAQEALEKLPEENDDKGAKLYESSFLNLTDKEWETAKQAVNLALKRMLRQGIYPGLQEGDLRSAIRSQIEDTVPPPAQLLAIELLSQVIETNLVKDEKLTREKAEKAAQNIEPEVVSVIKGEIIVQAGEEITQKDFVLLEHFNLSDRKISLWGFLGFSGLAVGSVGLFLLMEWRFHRGLRHRDHVLILLLTLSTPVLMLLNPVFVKFSNMPAVGLLIGSFYGSAIGVTVTVLATVLMAIGLEVTWLAFLPSAIGGILGSLIVNQLRLPFGETPRMREELALLGGLVGLAQGLVYLLLNTSLSPLWYAALGAAALQTLSGVVWGVIALGISPYLEHLFDLVTPVRLAELSNPNRPTLKRLTYEAPGTFQHTLFVATLAEAAARSLGCNVELVRAGTLYHDIGKMHDPLSFIENQMGGPNKHDELNDPWKSAEIIKKHVSQGLVMARKCRLPSAIQAFIPEHQGTMLISYFYHQAKQRAEENPKLAVNEADFRYDGPIPQSRETGIVMLADSCEAALRSLKDATPEEALAMVNKILKARWQDGQLVDSGLTRQEMNDIAQIFVQVWQQFHHQRIAYPKLSLTPPQPAIN